MRLFLKNALFTVLVPGLAAVYIPIRIAGGWPAVSTFSWSASGLAAVVPLALGAAIYLRCVWDFATTGRGTPAPIDAPRQLVVVGLYRYARNAMYLGVLSVITGWALVFRSWGILAYGGMLMLVFHLFVVYFEEPRLRRRFGGAYENYCRAVRRWIPGRAYDKVHE